MVDLRIAASTHPGLIREHNEDAYVTGKRLVAVADGVGGEAAGEVASALTAAALEPLNKGRPPRQPMEVLRSAVETASRDIKRSIVNNPEQHGMATTVTALLFTDDEVTIAHIGDSRAYLLRDGEFTQLTRDDTYVQVLIEQGSIEEAEVRTHPYRSMVTRVVSGQPVEAKLSTRPVAVGDRYLVCSDGLPDAADADDIATIVRQIDDPDECTAQLVDLALQGGGPDNITTVIADVVSPAKSTSFRGWFKR
ncbi:PP2C family protein-serine/threonine phosphatase [Stackebrandtia endophytica]|nr:protein phosphatase 2C domain-containing protein [Stackebrandtia endophytica]